MVLADHPPSARDEESVGALYENREVAEAYMSRRFAHAWGQLLHKKQLAEINRVIQETNPEDILEIAPGPARLAMELRGVRRGLMVDHSAAMLAVAQRRLKEAGLADLWKAERGNAFELEKLGRQFDVVFTFRFIRHFRLEERARLYRALASCLLSGGLLMFDVVNKTLRDKLDAAAPDKTEGELNVYDETYSPEGFRQEMAAHGFEVLRLSPVINHFVLQNWFSYRLGYRLPRLSSTLVDSLEQVPSRQPLEWIALCGKIG